MNTVKSRIEKLLKSKRSLRDDDRALWIEYLNKFHGLEKSLGIKAYQKFMNIVGEAPKFGTVMRCRAKLQENGQYLGKRRK